MQSRITRGKKMYNAGHEKIRIVVAGVLLLLGISPANLKQSAASPKANFTAQQIYGGWRARCPPHRCRARNRSLDPPVDRKYRLRNEDPRKKYSLLSRRETVRLPEETDADRNPFPGPVGQSHGRRRLLGKRQEIQFRPGSGQLPQGRQRICPFTGCWARRRSGASQASGQTRDRRT